VNNWFIALGNGRPPLSLAGSNTNIKLYRYTIQKRENKIRAQGRIKGAIGEYTSVITARFVTTGNKVPHCIGFKLIAVFHFSLAVVLKGFRRAASKRPTICNKVPPLVPKACRSRYEKKKLDAFGICVANRLGVSDGVLLIVLMTDVKVLEIETTRKTCTNKNAKYQF